MGRTDEFLITAVDAPEGYSVDTATQIRCFCSARGCIISYDFAELLLRRTFMCVIVWVNHPSAASASLRQESTVALISSGRVEYILSRRSVQDTSPIHDAASHPARTDHECPCFSMIKDSLLEARGKLRFDILTFVPETTGHSLGEVELDFLMDFSV